MKKSLLVLSTIGLLAVGLASCGDPSSVADVSSVASSVASSSAASSSAAASSDSVASSVASSVSSSADSTVVSSVAVEDTVKQMVAANFVKDAATSTISDGFFTGYGSATVFGNYLKTGGSSEVAKKSKYYDFTVTGAGSIYIKAKEGGSSGQYRNSDRVYIASAADDGSISAYVGRMILTYNTTTGKADECEATMVLPHAGKYYILSNDSVSIIDMKVTFNSSVASATADVNSETPEDVTILDPTELMPTPSLISGDKAVGNYTIHSTGASISYNSPRNFDLGGIVTYKGNVVKMTSADTISYTAAGAGTMNLYALASDSPVDGITIDVVDSSNTSVGTAAQLEASSLKTITAISFSITTADTYTIKTNTGANVYLYYAAFLGI